MPGADNKNKELLSKIEEIQHNFLVEIQKIKKERDAEIKSIIEKNDQEKIAAVTKHIKTIN